MLYDYGMTDYEIRLAAAEKGERTYHGRDCGHGHGGTRYTSNGMCVECVKQRSAARQQKLRDILKRNAT